LAASDEQTTDGFLGQLHFTEKLVGTDEGSNRFVHLSEFLLKDPAERVIQGEGYVRLDQEGVTLVSELVQKALYIHQRLFLCLHAFKIIT